MNFSSSSAGTSRSFARKYPWFSLALIVCGLIAVAEGWCIYERHATAHTLATKLAQKRAELQAMGDLTPPPARDVATAIEADLTRAHRSVDVMRAALEGHGPAAERMSAAKTPTARTDAFFDLATFGEKMRDLAKANEVDVRAEAARFGFSLYATEGPEQELIEPVFRQRQVAQYLLESLFAARPRALLSVQRETPLTKKDREDRAAAAANGQPTEATVTTTQSFADGSELFALDPRRSVRAPGVVDTTAFRIVFVGQTASLRTFLNRLASFELPIVVREVEAEPVSSEEFPERDSSTEAASSGATVPASIVLTTETTPPTSGRKAARTAASVAPIVPRSLSKFTLTVEYLELVPPPAPSA